MATAIVGVLAVIALVAWWSMSSRYSSPKAAMRAFLAQDGARAEEQLIDPLVIAGEPVVPAVIAHIEAGGELRQYACVFLGNGPYPQGLPVLRSVVGNVEEQSMTRGYALASIYRIDPKEAMGLARQYYSEGGYLGITARELVEGSGPNVFSRSYLAALTRWKL